MVAGNRNSSENQATIYPPSLEPPFAGASPPTKLDGSLRDGGTVSYFRDYRNETLSKFTMPSYEWGFQRTPYSPRPDLAAANKTRDVNKLLTVPSNNITTIDAARIKEVDDFFKGVQLHRNQYKDHSGLLHPLAFFKTNSYEYQCAPAMTSSYFSKYPQSYISYKLPPVLPLTDNRRKRTPYIPELSLSGIYSRTEAECVTEVWHPRNETHEFLGGDVAHASEIHFLKNLNDYETVLETFKNPKLHLFC